MKRFWNRLLILLHLRRDWVNELDLVPPAFDNVAPHAYDPEMNGKVLTYCAQCGGGPKHGIHNVRSPYSATAEQDASEFEDLRKYILMPQFPRVEPPKR